MMKAVGSAPDSVCNQGRAERATPSWERAVYGHTYRVCKFASGLTHDQHDAEDLTQDVIERALRNMSAYTSGNFE
jgi:DNA-directed RNA polymerase specialized sigma24 family protein